MYVSTSKTKMQHETREHSNVTVYENCSWARTFLIVVVFQCGNTAQTSIDLKTVIQVDAYDDTHQALI